MSFAEHNSKSLANAIDFKSNNNAKFGTNIQQSKDDYSFPMMKMDDIYVCLQELNIHISVDDLKKPEQNIAIIQHLYEALVEVCSNLSRDDLSQAAFAGLQKLSYPNLHELSIPKANLLRACQKMMEMVEVKGFTIKDLMAPTAKRLRLHLSGIINFVKFKEERLLLLSELGANRQNLLDKASQSKDNNFVLNNRLSILREQTAEEGAQISKFEIECREMETAITAMNDLQTSIRHEYDTLSTQNDDLKRQIAETSVMFEDATCLNKKLSQQIVSSPEKFRKLIIDVGMSLQNEQKDAKHAERKVRDLSAWLANVEEACTEVGAAVDSVNEVRGEVERQKAVILELDARKQETQSNRVALSEINQNVQQFARHVARAEDKLSNLRKQSAVKGEDAQRAVNDLHQQLLDAEAKRLQVRARAERIDGEATRQDREAEAEYLQQEQEITEIVSSYQRLERIVTSHLQTMQHVMLSDSKIERLQTSCVV